MIRRLTTALLTTAALVASPVSAQPQLPEPPRPASAEMDARRAEVRTQHAEDLKTLLRLRPDQEAALAAFVAAMEPPPGPPERSGPPALARSTPDHLQRMARLDAERNARRDAIARFYAALSPEQQKAFDAVGRLAHGPRPGAGPFPGRPGGGPDRFGPHGG